ncbi:hypothetical protein [Mesorhizobium sp. NPDC059025]|uniref:DUF7668 domain-containing protein n=1 Tax=unclassified Mesorhizobium TaxID=325217 RepID=UPI0036CA12BD
MTSAEAIESAVNTVMALLVERRYAEIERITGGIRMNAGDLGNIVSEYGIEIVMPPEGRYRELDVISVSLAGMPTFSVVTDVWTKIDGKSDVSIEMTVKIDGEDVIVEIDKTAR